MAGKIPSVIVDVVADTSGLAGVGNDINKKMKGIAGAGGGIGGGVMGGGGAFGSGGAFAGSLMGNAISRGGGGGGVAGGAFVGGGAISPQTRSDRIWEGVQRNMDIRRSEKVERQNNFLSRFADRRAEANQQKGADSIMEMGGGAFMGVDHDGNFDSPLEKKFAKYDRRAAAWRNFGTGMARAPAQIGAGMGVVGGVASEGMTQAGLGLAQRFGMRNLATAGVVAGTVGAYKAATFSKNQANTFRDISRFEGSNNYDLAASIRDRYVGGANGFGKSIETPGLSESFWFGAEQQSSGQGGWMNTGLKNFGNNANIGMRTLGALMTDPAKNLNANPMDLFGIGSLAQRLMVGFDQAGIESMTKRGGN
jgi:hypothetical protein